MGSIEEPTMMSAEAVASIVAGAVAKAMPNAISAAVEQIKAELNPLKEEIALHVAASKEQRDTLSKASSDFRVQQKQGRVDAFITSRARKINAFELDETNPAGTLRDVLMELSDEKKSSAKASPLDMMFAQIDARPDRKDSNGFAVGDGKTAPPSPQGIKSASVDPRRDKIGDWCDKDGAAILEKQRTNKAEFMAEYDAANEEFKGRLYASYVLGQPLVAA